MRRTAWRWATVATLLGAGLGGGDSGRAARADDALTEYGALQAGVGRDAEAEAQQVERLAAWRAQRDAKVVPSALEHLRAAAAEGRNVMEPSIACAKAGVTTGEWAETLRRIFGEYRAPTGVGQAVAGASSADRLAALRARVVEVAQTLLSGGLTIRQAAESLNVETFTLKGWLKEAGIQISPAAPVAAGSPRAVAFDVNLGDFGNKGLVLLVAVVHSGADPVALAEAPLRQLVLDRHHVAVRSVDLRV